MLTIALVLLIAAAAVVGVTPVVDRHRRGVLRRCLRDVADVLNRGGVEYWCDYGTLLGQHREGDLILGDKDVDLCAFAEEKPRVLALAPELERRGYQVTDQGGASRRILRVSDRITSYHVDIYTFSRDGEMLRSVLQEPEEDIPERLVASRVPVAFLGTTVMVPRDTPALLLYRYGPGYTRPQRNDKGRARPYSRLRSVYEDLWHNCVGLWTLAATAAGRVFARAPR